MPRPSALPQRRRRQPPQQHQASRSSSLDPWHNRDQPCCQELAEICRQVLEAGQSSASSSSSSSYPTLFDFVRHYLVEASRSLVPVVAPVSINSTATSNSAGVGASMSSSSSANSTAAAAKKKRKKKKKKGKSDDNDDEIDNNEDGTDAPPPTTSAEGSSALPPSEQEEEEPPCVGDTNPDPGTVKAGGRSTECSESSPEHSRHTTIPPPPPRSRSAGRRVQQPTLFDMMVHEYFAATTPTTASVAPAVLPTQAQEFWKFVDQAAAASTTTSVPSSSVANHKHKSRNNGVVVPGPAVSVTALQHLKDCIACDKCRAMVDNLLETEHKCVLYRPPSSLQPSEHAYSLMEEGTLDETFVWRLQQQRELAFHLAVNDEADDEMVWLLGGMGFGEPTSDPHRGNNHNNDNDPIEDESGQRHQALDWRRVVLYNYVLARGVAGTDLVGAAVPPNHPEAGAPHVPVQPLDPSVVRGIADTVQSTLLGQQGIFRDCANGLERLLEAINEHPTRGSHKFELTESNIDMAAFSNLKDVDDECCKIMNQLLRLILDLTSSFFVAYAAASDDAPSWRKHDLHHLQELVLHLWDCWLEYLQRVVHDISAYEGYTGSLTDRHGQYPQPFFSSTYREFYRELVKHKLTCVYQLLDKLRKLADSETETPGMHPEDHKASAHRKLLTYSIFCQHTMGMDYKRAHPWTPLDVEVQGVLDAALECFTTPIRATWQQVQLEHENRGQRLLRRCGSVFGTSNQQIKSLKGSILHLLGSPSQEPQSDQIVSNGDDERNAVRTVYRNNLKEALMPLLRAWFMEQRIHWIHRSSTCIPLMPASLLRTMVFENEDHECFQRGHTRTACFFVVLLFRWLSDVHEAWRANMAEQDLLKSMLSLEAEAPLVDGGLDTSASTSSKVGKQGKKKKKKKVDARTAEPPNTPLSDEVPVQSSLPALNGTTEPELEHPRISKTPETPESGVTTEDMPNLKQSRESNGNATNSAPPAVNAPSFDQSIENALNGDLKDSPIGTLTVANEIRNGESKRTAPVTVVKSGHYESSKRSALPSLEEFVRIDACAKVGLDDASGNQSAEDFLVGRLMAVLQDPGS